MLFSIYILRCAGNRFYIGRTVNPNRRIKQHFKGNGSRWTKLHQPEKVVKIYRTNGLFAEDKYTLEYMGKHGIQNVRGGSFTNPVLHFSEINVIQKMLKTATGKSQYCKYLLPEHYPENHYKNWTKEEDNIMIKEWKQHKSIDKIATLLKRSNNAIHTRMFDKLFDKLLPSC